MTEAFLIIFVPLAGLVLGSLVTTAALRAAQGEQCLTGRSHCDACGVGLTFAATIPVLSFIGCRGACADCGARINPTHLLGEIAGLLILTGALILSPGPRGILVASLGLSLLAACVYELRTSRSSDVPTLMVVGCAVLLAVTGSFAALGLGLAAGALTFVALEAVRRGVALARREPGLGVGDVKLAAALAIWLGALTPWMMVVASLLTVVSLLIRPAAERRIGFGPMIAVSAFGLGLLGEGRLWPSGL